jgi:hypothetical protein
VSGTLKRDALDRLIVRVPALVGSSARRVRRIPPGSPLRKRLINFQVKRAFAAMARSDVEVVALFYEPDAEVEMVGMAALGLNEHYRGHDGIRAIYADVDEVFSDWHWAISAIADGGDRLAVRTDFVGYGRGSGAKTELTGGGTAAKVSDRGLVTWQGWFVDQGGWEQALQSVGLSGPVT